MGLQKITDAEFLVDKLNKMIKRLELDRDEILARIPDKEPVERVTQLIAAGGQTFDIKGRKQA